MPTLAMPPVDAKESAAAVKQLAEFFHRNGYVRQRANGERDPKSKKGSEIRLTANSKSELQTIRRLLRDAGFEAGKPYAQSNQFRQPIYGHTAVQRFLKLVGKKPVKSPAKSGPPK
jgi:hypothetical protein